MKNLRISIFLLWFAVLPAAHPQEKGIADGRLVNRTDPSIVARGVDLEVIELGAGMSIIRTAVTDASGKFHIEGLPLDRRLMIRAVYKGANYHSQLTFTAGKADAEIGVYEPTTSMKGIEIAEFQIAFRAAGGRLESLDLVTFNNKTQPPRTLILPDGTFRFSKLPGLLELPNLRITAPGSMPLVQAPLESPDGTYYYTLYPLRPGSTTFEVQQQLPYQNKTYSYVKKFFYDVSNVHIGVIPQDMKVTGSGLSKIETSLEKNFSVYLMTSVKAGTEVDWQFSGGSDVPETPAGETTSSREIIEAPGLIGRYAPPIGALLLLGLILVLWYAFNRTQTGDRSAQDSRIRQLKDQRERLLNSVADLDYRLEAQSIGKEEYLRNRAESMRRLRRIYLLLKRH